MKKEIIETIRATLYLKEGTVDEATTIEAIAKDSMDVVELIAVLSSKYQVRIEPAKMNNIETVGDIVRYISENQGSAQGTSPLESF